MKCTVLFALTDYDRAIIVRSSAAEKITFVVLVQPPVLTRVSRKDIT